MSSLKYQITGLSCQMNPFVYHRREKLVLQLLWQSMGDLHNQSPHQRRHRLIELVDQIAIKEDPTVRDEIRIHT